MFLTQDDYSELTTRLTKTERNQLSNMCLYFTKEMLRVKKEEIASTDERSVLFREMYRTCLSDFVCLYTALGNTNKLLLDDLVDHTCSNGTTITGTLVLISFFNQYYTNVLKQLEKEIENEEGYATKEVLREKQVMIGEVYFNKHCLQSLASSLPDKQRDILYTY